MLWILEWLKVASTMELLWCSIVLVLGLILSVCVLKICLILGCYFLIVGIIAPIWRRRVKRGTWAYFVNQRGDLTQCVILRTSSGVAMVAVNLQGHQEPYVILHRLRDLYPWADTTYANPRPPSTDLKEHKDENPKCEG